MRSTSSTRSVIVGIFTLLGIAILAVTILTLGDQRSTFNESLVVTSFYNNVNGLQKGNNIWFNGVKVGTIKSVDIIDNDKIEVKMNINQSARQFIHNDIKAKLSTDGLIGNKIVALFGGTSQAPVIKNGDIIQTDELLNTDEVMNTLSKNNDNLLAITANLRTITAGIADGKGALGKLLNDETLVDQLTALASSLNKSAGHVDQLTKVAADYTEKLNTPGTLANDLVTDTTLFDNLRQITSRLRAVSDSSQTVINNLKVTGANINAAIESGETPIGMLMNDKGSAESIKTTLSTLQSASKKLDEDLEALQHNFLLRGFFRKKAKEAENRRIVLDTVVGN